MKGQQVDMHECITSARQRSFTVNMADDGHCDVLVTYTRETSHGRYAAPLLCTTHFKPVLIMSASFSYSKCGRCGHNEFRHFVALGCCECICFDFINEDEPKTPKKPTKEQLITPTKPDPPAMRQAPPAPRKRKPHHSTEEPKKKGIITATLPTSYCSGCCIEIDDHERSFTDGCKDCGQKGPWCRQECFIDHQKNFCEQKENRVKCRKCEASLDGDDLAVKWDNIESGSLCSLCV